MSETEAHNWKREIGTGVRELEESAWQTRMATKQEQVDLETEICIDARKTEKIVSEAKTVSGVARPEQNGVNVITKNLVDVCNAEEQVLRETFGIKTEKDLSERELSSGQGEVAADGTNGGTSVVSIRVEEDALVREYHHDFKTIPKGSLKTEASVKVMKTEASVKVMKTEASVKVMKTEASVKVMKTEHERDESMRAQMYTNPRESERSTFEIKIEPNGVKNELGDHNLWSLGHDTLARDTVYGKMDSYNNLSTKTEIDVHVHQTRGSSPTDRIGWNAEMPDCMRNKTSPTLKTDVAAACLQSETDNVTAQMDTERLWFPTRAIFDGDISSELVLKISPVRLVFEPTTVIEAHGIGSLKMETDGETQAVGVLKDNSSLMMFRHGEIGSDNAVSPMCVEESNIAEECQTEAEATAAADHDNAVARIHAEDDIVEENDKDWIEGKLATMSTENTFGEENWRETPDLVDSNKLPENPNRNGVPLETTADRQELIAQRSSKKPKRKKKRFSKQQESEKIRKTTGKVLPHEQFAQFPSKLRKKVDAKKRSCQKHTKQHEDKPEQSLRRENKSSLQMHTKQHQKKPEESLWREKKPSLEMHTKQNEDKPEESLRCENKSSLEMHTKQNEDKPEESLRCENKESSLQMHTKQNEDKPEEGLRREKKPSLQMHTKQNEDKPGLRREKKPSLQMHTKQNEDKPEEGLHCEQPPEETSEVAAASRQNKKCRNYTTQHPCPVCGKVYLKRLWFDKHVALHKDDMALLVPRTDIVGGIVEDQGTRLGEAKLPPIKNYLCYGCGKAYSKPCHLLKHEMSHVSAEHKPDTVSATHNTGKAEHQCHICGKMYGEAYQVLIHLRRHTGERPYKCDQCQAAFPRNSERLQHIRTKHSKEKPYKCDVCPAAFVRRDLLTYHCLTHNGEKPYACRFCSAGFTLSGNRQVHERRRHAREILYQCSVCSATFLVKGHLKAHAIAWHTGEDGLSRTVEKPYSCTECSAPFLRYICLQKHMRNQHSARRLYKCSRCTEKFTSKSELSVHARSHIGEKPFSCVKCSASFSLKAFLDNHMVKKHDGI